MIPGEYDRHNGINGTSLITANTAKRKAESTRVLSTKVSSEDYGAYKIAADHLFNGSVSHMLKIALRRYVRGQAVNDDKFENIKRCSKNWRS
jgi:hypothetical protein